MRLFAGAPPASATSPRPLAQAGFLVLADGATKGAGALVALILARAYGPALYGDYAAISALVGLCLMLTALGFEQELTRRGGLAPQRLARDLSTAMSSLLACLVASLAVFGLLLSTGPYDTNLFPMALTLALAVLAGRFVLPFRHAFLARGQSHVTAGVHGLATLVLLAGMLLGVGAGVSMPWQIRWQLAISLTTLCAWILLARRCGLRHESTSLADKLEFARAALPFAMANVVWIAYFNFDAYWLSLWRTEVEVGLYAGVYRLMGITYILGYAFSNAYSPRLFALWQDDRAAFGRTSRSMTLQAGAMGLLLALALVALAGPLTVTVLGEVYRPAIGAAKLLAASVCFRFVNFTLCELLTTSSRQPQRIFWEGLLLAVNVAANVLLVPGWGIIGAAWAILAAEVLLFCGCVWATRRLLLGEPR